MLDLILKITIGCNLFFAGYHLADNINSCHSRKQTAVLILWCLGTIFFGTPYVLISIFIALLSTVFKRFQLGFWFKYLFTNEFRNLEEEQLYSANDLLINKFYKGKPNSLKAKYNMYLLSLINKRHNYTFSEKQENDED